MGTFFIGVEWVIPSLVGYWYGFVLVVPFFLDDFSRVQASLQNSIRKLR